MKMSDYILEQDISSASVMDIEIQQAYAEMAVASALMDCYLKQATIMEYASCDASEFGVFVESDDSTSKESKGFINTIKNAWNKFINWIKSTFKALVMAISKKSPEKTLYYLEKCPDDATFKLSAPVLRNIDSFTHLYDALDDLLKVLESGPEYFDTATCQSIIDTVDRWFKTDDKGKPKTATLEDIDEGSAVYTKGELIRVLKKMNDQDPVKKTKELYKKMEKSLQVNKKDYDDVNSLDGIPADFYKDKKGAGENGQFTKKQMGQIKYAYDAKVRKEDMDLVKEAVNKTGRAVVDLTRSLNAVFDEVVRKAYKESKKKKD